MRGNLAAPLPQGVVLLGVQVVTTDLVVAKVCNLTGAAMDQVVDLPVRIVTFG